MILDEDHVLQSLRATWQPVANSASLAPGAVMGVTLLETELVLARFAEGRLLAADVACPHKGARLSAGCIREGELMCPYHGWRFNSQGICTRIPSIGKATKPPPRARVDAYPVEERYGIVFAFLGDLPEDQRPPIMPVPEHGTDEWRSTLVTFDVNYHYERSIENGLDPAHNEYVHTTHGYQGEREDTYLMTELRPHQNNPWGYGFLSTFDAPPLKNPIMRQFRKKGGKMEAGSGTYGPNHMWTYINFSPKTAMHQYMFEAPIDEHRTRVFLLNQRNIGFFKASKMGLIGKPIKTRLNAWLDKKINERNMFIASQDITVMNNVVPRLTPPSRSKELMMPADKVILQYRDKLDEFEASGWRIDMEALRKAREQGDVVFAIPCPARRETNAWVLDETPRVAPKPKTTMQAAG
jgi:phenylpropionate dioxygenase-like ring-hydroxylating dioxygenase large terminal subunit